MIWIITKQPLTLRIVSFIIIDINNNAVDRILWSCVTAMFDGVILFLNLRFCNTAIVLDSGVIFAQFKSVRSCIILLSF